MIKQQICLLIITFFICCNNKNGNKCSINKTVSLCLGIHSSTTNNVGNSDLESVLNDLSLSNELSAFRVTSKYLLAGNELNINGLVGEKEFQVLMIKYRYLDYLDESTPQNLTNLLSSISLDKSDSLCFRKLLDIELTYLSGLSKDYGELNLIKSIEQIKKYKEEFPGSFRIRYLLANLFWIAAKKESAIIEYKELISNEYYKYKSLRKVIEYYYAMNIPDSTNKYLKESTEEFSNKCIPEKLMQSSSDSEFFIECDKCLTGNNKKDSIISKIELIKFYLNKRNFEKVMLGYKKYDSANVDLGLDDVKVWERGEYYDLILRTFFLQKDFKKFTNFIIRNVGYNKKILVNNERQFKELVYGYFLDYNVGASEEKFETFYKKSFGILYKNEILKTS